MVSKLTKRALAASLKKLLAQKPLSKITIADITEDCGMNRMTFYYHFQDIYDLIDWICQEEGERAFQGRKGYNTWQEGVHCPVPRGDREPGLHPWGLPFRPAGASRKLLGPGGL